MVVLKKDIYYGASIISVVIGFVAIIAQVSRFVINDGPLVENTLFDWANIPYAINWILSYPVFIASLTIVSSCPLVFGVNSITVKIQTFVWLATGFFTLYLFQFSMHILVAVMFLGVGIYFCHLNGYFKRFFVLKILGIVFAALIISLFSPHGDDEILVFISFCITIGIGILTFKKIIPYEKQKIKNKTLISFHGENQRLYNQLLSRIKQVLEIMEQ